MVANGKQIMYQFTGLNKRNGDMFREFGIRLRVLIANVGPLNPVGPVLSGIN